MTTVNRAIPRPSPIAKAVGLAAIFALVVAFAFQTTALAASETHTWEHDGVAYTLNYTTTGAGATYTIDLYIGNEKINSTCETQAGANFMEGVRNMTFSAEGDVSRYKLKEITMDPTNESPSISYADDANDKGQTVSGGKKFDFSGHGNFGQVNFTTKNSWAVYTPQKASHCAIRLEEKPAPKVSFDKGEVMSFTESLPEGGTSPDGNYAIPKDAVIYSSGALFMGWKDEGSGRTYKPGETVQNISQDTKLIAQWADSDAFDALFSPVWEIAPEKYDAQTQQMTARLTLTNTSAETLSWAGTDHYLTSNAYLETGPDAGEVKVVDHAVDGQASNAWGPGQTLTIDLSLSFGGGISDFSDEMKMNLLLSLVHGPNNKNTYIPNFTKTIAPDMATLSFSVADTGAQGAPESLSVLKGSLATIPSDVPTLAGKTFIGWKGADDALVLPKDQIRVTGDATLLAQWIDIAAPKDVDVTAEVAKPLVEMGAQIDKVDEASVKEAAEAAAIDKSSMNALATEALKETLSSGASAVPDSEDDLKEALRTGGVTADAPDAAPHVVVETYLDVSVVDFEKKGDEAESITFDVTPMYTVIATTAKDGEAIHVQGDGSQGAPNAVVLQSPEPLAVTRPVTLTLGLPKGFGLPKQSVYVNHEHEGRRFEYMSQIEKGTDETLSVSFTNPDGFSKFTVYKTSKIVARIENADYFSWQEAVDAVKDGQTIVVTGDCSGATATAHEAKSFTVKAEGGKPGTVTAAPGLNVSASPEAEGTRYTVSATASPSVPHPDKPDKPEGTDPTPDNPGPDDSDKPETKAITVYRLYNQYNGAHLITADRNEYDTLPAFGWTQEGEAFQAPDQGDAIWRLYNPNNGDHIYTKDANEYQELQETYGWIGEDVAFHSADAGEGVSVWRLFNPYMTDDAGLGAHLWTTDENEYDTLFDLGWNQEGEAWRALA